MRSINVSNHKFGLVYPGMGTLLFRDGRLPEELVFHINYLGGDMPNYSLNFSRPAVGGAAVLQLPASRARGYEEIVDNMLANAQALAAKLARVEGLRAAQRRRATSRSSRCGRRPRAGPDLNELSERLREHGWIVPAYTLPPNAEHITVLRIVVKENFSRDMADMLDEDIHRAMHDLNTGAPREHRARTRPHC